MHSSPRYRWSNSGERQRKSLWGQRRDSRTAVNRHGGQRFQRGAGDSRGRPVGGCHSQVLCFFTLYFSLRTGYLNKPCSDSYLWFWWFLLTKFLHSFHALMPGSTEDTSHQIFCLNLHLRAEAKVGNREHPKPSDHTSTWHQYQAYLAVLPDVLNVQSPKLTTLPTDFPGKGSCKLSGKLSTKYVVFIPELVV